ncbi:ribonucleases P/MRP protein subunit POP1-like [Striga asiatica]|uniref:Ribonucleases P/MRP protein subunit POP1-like n=1 Tax=Striga asiatica TaxID=4170 RepID=A0A5A7P2Z3_STRAF|nr:ribonucleases P/MRP protein subunit POP1-like [Striga asiatica]
MVNNGSKAGVSTGAPRELNVWKFVESRAPELEGLHTIVAQRLDHSFRSQRNKRRRTTGHDNRVAKKKPRKKRKVGEDNTVETDLERTVEKKVPRRVRRNIELKKNPSSGFGTSTDGTKRLRTHVWHAKRFTMKKLWGFYIPLGLHGRGRGSRALLKKLKHGSLVHDASYYGSLQLQGPEGKLISVIGSVLVPSPSACCEETSHDILAGTIFGSAMLHHPGKTCFSPIAPVTYMWRPRQGISTDTERLRTDVSDGEQKVCDETIIRQLLVWVHAAAFQEAYDSLSSACGRHHFSSNAYEVPRKALEYFYRADMTPSAHCVSREGQLARLELVGSKVFELLQKTLLPASCKCSFDEHVDLGESEKTSIFHNGHQNSSTSIVSVVVKDPRLLTKKGNVIVPEVKPRGLSSNGDFQVEEQTCSSVPEHEAEFAIQNCDLWDARKGACPPMEESILCLKKHNSRKEFFRLGHQSSEPQSSVPGEYSSECPVLLLKHGTSEKSVTRCSIILPLSWVKAFWIVFVSNGAHAIGLREKQWVACELGLPYFPLDYPDCNAYSDYMAKEAIEINQKAILRPLSKRPFEIPIPPPWNCLHLTLENRLKSEPQDKTSAFEGIVARTSVVLSENLKTNSDKKLFCFPRKPYEENCLYKVIRDIDFLKQDTVLSENKCGKTPCYVRVVLRAYKEGVFEQGALVCAPLLADIRMWKAGSESDYQSLQIPQSSLRSYFMHLPSGEWELQIPEDQSLHRWPIGFVTTGFVRGRQVLKKSTAVALCEASMLSMLREEQWKAVPVRQRKEEIYVLVRNMRSTSYRLALGTIILEQQEKDVEFM